VSPSNAKSKAGSKRTGSSAGARSSNRSLAPADKLKLAPPDRLKREIQAVLTDKLRSNEHRNGFGKYDGFAYPAAEAYFHLAGGYAAGLQPMHLKYRGNSHWWIVDKEGHVIDLTLGTKETSDFPYDRGLRRNFRYTPAGLSRRAQTIAAEVKAKISPP
jgi:hypothetical protein